MNRRRIRVGRGVVVALAVTVLPAALPTTASADPISDQKALVAKVTDQLEALEKQSDILAENYVTAIDEKQQLDAQVAVAEKKVGDQQAAVDALRGQLSQVAVQAYMGAGTGGSSPMFSSSQDVTDSLARDQLSRVAMSAGAATTDQYDQAVKDLQQEQAKLDDARNQADAKAKQLAADKKATDEQKAVYTKARADAEAKLGDLIRQEEERRARESYLRAQRAAEEAAARQRAAAQASAAQQAQAAAARSGGGGSAHVRAIAASAPAAAVPQSSSRAGAAIAAALSQQGVAYRFAASSPGQAFDCSGLTSWAWAQAGVSLPHQSRAQAGTVPRVPTGDAQPGDLIFYYSPISHVAIYLGNGMMVHAPNSGDVVKEAPVNWDNVVGVGRPG
jgi:cell wall-associated NlpC family hydrolase